MHCDFLWLLGSQLIIISISVAKKLLKNVRKAIETPSFLSKKVNQGFLCGITNVLYCAPPKIPPLPSSPPLDLLKQWGIRSKQWLNAELWRLGEESWRNRVWKMGIAGRRETQCPAVRPFVSLMGVKLSPSLGARRLLLVLMQTCYCSGLRACGEEGGGHPSRLSLLFKNWSSLAGICQVQSGINTTSLFPMLRRKVSMCHPCLNSSLINGNGGAIN